MNTGSLLAFKQNLNYPPVQIESRGGTNQEGGGQGQKGVHQARVSQEEAAEADGGHGHCH